MSIELGYYLSDFPQYFPHTPANENRNILITNILRRKIDGGQGGIRTLGTVASTHTFQACSFDHSDTCPLIDCLR